MTRQPAIKIPIFLGKQGKLPFQTALKGIEPDAPGELNIGDKKHQNRIVKCELRLARQMDARDGRYYSAICGLYDAGADITPCSIHLASGFTPRPNTRQKESILSVVHDFFASSLLYDGTEIPLLTGRTIEQTESKKGRFAGSLIELDETPGLYAYVQQTDRYLTSVDAPFLEMPGRQTNTTIAVQTYIFERIARARYEERASVAISYDSLFSKFGIDSNQARKTEGLYQRKATRMRTAVRDALNTAAAAAVTTGAVASASFVYATGTKTPTGVRLRLRKD